MASVADRKRSRRVRTAVRTEDVLVAQRAEAAGVIVGAGPREIEERQPYVRRVTGLAFLAGRGRIDAAQLKAGERYGRAFRILDVRDGAPIKSGLAEPERAGGGQVAMRPPELDYALAREVAVARDELHQVRTLGLQNHGGLVAVLDVIAGKGWTPGEVTVNQREQEAIVVSLQIALDLARAQYVQLDKSI